MDLLWYGTLVVMAAVWLLSSRRPMVGRPELISTRQPDSPRPTVNDVFDPAANSLNAMRLALAALVIVWHSFPVTGRSIENAALRQALSEIPVDGFFALSGFLIAGAWLRRPDAARFIRARVMRIFPGFLVCLLVTAVVLAPVGILLSPEQMPSGYPSEAVHYVAGNATLKINQYGIDGTPAGVPYPDVWNGSLWTLRWEFFCYAGILLIGLLGLLRRPIACLAMFAMATMASLTTTLVPGIGFGAENWARFGTMFMAGVIILVFRDRIPSRGWMTAVAAIIVVGAQFTDNYRVVGAIFLAYALITVAGRIRWARLRLSNDISYGVYIYAFPVQQVLASTTLVTAPVGVFAISALVLTVPLAVLSWFAVEKPLLARARRRRAAPALSR